MRLHSTRVTRFCLARTSGIEQKILSVPSAKSAFIALGFCAAVMTITACSSTGERQDDVLSGSTASQMRAMNQRITELTELLKATQADAAAARQAAEQAQITAEAAQDMSASTDDKIESMFQRSVFK